MPTDLDEQLQGLGVLLRELSPPIAPSEYQRSPLIDRPTADDAEQRPGELELAESRPRSVTPRRTVAIRATASMVAAAAVVGCLVLLTRRDASSTVNAPEAETTTTSQPTGTVIGGDATGAFVGAEAPPLFSMPLDGWSVSYFDDTTTARDRFVAVNSVQGFAGGSFVVLPATSNGQVTSGTDLQPQGIDGLVLGTGDNFRWFEWHIGDQVLSAHARHITEADALALVKSIVVGTDGSVTVSAPPAGMVVLPDSQMGNLTRYVEYHWTNADKSKTIGITMQPGGDLGVQGVDQGGYQPTTFGGRPAYLASGGMAVTLLDRFWVWSIGGEGYTTSDEFLADALAITKTDEATWRSELSGHAILPSERPTQVADILSDIPLPTDFDTAHLTDSGIAKVRYQLVAEVTSAVWCAWVQKWDAALTAGDTAVAADAAAAIASSKTWHSLTEIANQGGWSEVMWRNAQRVADGDRTVAAEAASGEGCDQA